MTPTFHPIGIILAIGFVLAMGLLFRWMFNVPPQVPREVASVRRSVAALQRILVPVVGAVVSERAVELACRLGAEQKAEIILAYIIEVPFTLSLGTPMPEERQKGEATLNMGQLIVAQHGLPSRTIVLPHRYAWSGILHIAEEQMVDAIVLGLTPPRRREPLESLGRTTREVLRRAECEVIIDRAAA